MSVSGPEFVMRVLELHGISGGWSDVIEVYDCDKPTIAITKLTIAISIAANSFLFNTTHEPPLSTAIVIKNF